MRLNKIKSKNSTNLYIIESVYDGRKNRTVIVEKLGNLEHVMKTHNTDDPIAWAKKRVEELNQQRKKEKENKTQETQVSVTFDLLSPNELNKKIRFNAGYLFLQDILYQLGLKDICTYISSKYKFDYDLEDIFAKLIYSRIMYPRSKKSTFELSSKYLEQPNFDLHQIYRSLDVIANEDTYIQQKLYEGRTKVLPLNKKILYYDCTNYYFEIDKEDGFRMLGKNKENRPNPIVQMGLFTDMDGIPLSFSLHSGNTNEQVTLKPLEKQLIDNYKISKLVVCTDAGLSSYENRIYNSFPNRAFITVQSLKKLPKDLQHKALSSKGWKLFNDKKTYNLDEVDSNVHFESVFYKEILLAEKGIYQKLIVTFSFKYKHMLSQKRNAKINKAMNIIDRGPASVNKVSDSNPRKYISFDIDSKSSITYTIDEKLIDKEAKFDGFYAVATNLEDNALEILQINSRRYIIENDFRIMKSEFRARPVFLKRENRIRAHFTTCFTALLVLRILESKLDNKYQVRELIETLKDMDLTSIKNNTIHLCQFKRTQLTEDLQRVFGFTLDNQATMTLDLKHMILKTKGLKHDEEKLRPEIYRR